MMRKVIPWSSEENSAQKLLMLQIGPEINECLITIPRLLAVNHPLIRQDICSVEVLLLDANNHLGPKDSGEVAIRESAMAILASSTSGLIIKCSCGHNHMGMEMILEITILHMKHEMGANSAL